jgi:transposase
MSDHKGARLMFDHLPPAKRLIADRGYDSDRFRAALTARGTTPCIPPRKNRRVQHPYDTTLYRQRYRVEVMFGRLKDWRRIAMRYDRCAHTFMSAIVIAATVIFWINQRVLTLVLLHSRPPETVNLPVDKFALVRRQIRLFTGGGTCDG